MVWNAYALTRKTYAGLRHDRGPIAI